MARPSLSIIQSLRATARRLEAATGLKAYQWGHMGSCNCGHLAQTITRRTSADIHAGALRTRFGDWEAQLRDHCPASGRPLDDIIDELLEAGFTHADLTHLERLTDPAVRALLPAGQRHTLRHNARADVIAYLQAWADLLEGRLLATVPAIPTELAAGVAPPVRPAAPTLPAALARLAAPVLAPA